MSSMATMEEIYCRLQSQDPTLPTLASFKVAPDFFVTKYDFCTGRMRDDTSTYQVALLVAPTASGQRQAVSKRKPRVGGGSEGGGRQEEEGPPTKRQRTGQGRGTPSSSQSGVSTLLLPPRLSDGGMSSSSSVTFTALLPPLSIIDRDACLEFWPAEHSLLSQVPDAVEEVTWLSCLEEVIGWEAETSAPSSFPPPSEPRLGGGGAEEEEDDDVVVFAVGDFALRYFPELIHDIRLQAPSMNRW